MLLSDPDSSSTPVDRLAHNTAEFLRRAAATVPDQAAVVVVQSRDSAGKPVYAQQTFAEMERLSNRYANGLASAGVVRGMRVVMMVRPGFEFTALVFALLKLGAPPVLIDPGMGLSRLLECIRQVDAQAMIGIPLAHVVRKLRPRAFEAVRVAVTVGRRWLWGGPTLEGLAAAASDVFEPIVPVHGETAAILFTSGSTGPAKGVLYEHGMFNAQVAMIQSCYDMRPGEIDLSTFPLFALFATGMGMTSVIPQMDAARPGRADPAKIVEAIHDHSITSAFGSPALWRRVATWCTAHSVKLPSMRRILIAGAPVPTRVIEQLRRALPAGADVHTPYGATESLPVATIAGREIVEGCAARTDRGAGTCVGRALPGVDLRIIRITDEPIAAWSDDLLAAPGEIGEIIARSPAVTRGYFRLPAADAVSKIRDGATVWHRIGDVGRMDEQGRLWFAGRRSHRVETAAGVLFTECCEPVFNRHPAVARCALVGVGTAGAKEPVLVVEPADGRPPRGAARDRLIAELLAFGAEVAHTRAIRRILFHPSLPVDVRHNAKINREQLARWAEGRR
jgi:acyl-CoA synthetase (AMP-forming)/AMP-acid ligase II